MESQAKQLQDARAAKEKARILFRRLGRVCGVGITRLGDSYAVKVNLEAKPARGTQLPQEIDGVPIVVQITGPIYKLPA